MERAYWRLRCVVGAILLLLCGCAPQSRLTPTTSPAVAGGRSGLASTSPATRQSEATPRARFENSDILYGRRQFHFRQTPLAEALSQVTVQRELGVYVEWEELAIWGLTPDLPVTADIGPGSPATDIAELIRSVRPGRSPGLSWFLMGRVVVVTTSRRLENLRGYSRSHALRLQDERLNMARVLVESVDRNMEAGLLSEAEGGLKQLDALLKTWSTEELWRCLKLRQEFEAKGTKPK